MSEHDDDEWFVLVERDALRVAAFPPWSIGAPVSVVLSGASSPAAESVVTAQTLLPFTPVNLAAELLSNGDLSLNWTRRSRKGAWIDSVDAPLAEAREEYRISIIGSAGAVEQIALSSELIVPAADLARAGSGPATIQVRQAGGWAVSPPAEATLTI